MGCDFPPPSVTLVFSRKQPNEERGCVLASTLAISYIRFSSPAQRSGDSLRRQTENTKTFCQRYDLFLDESYSYRDLAQSSFNGKNARKGDLKIFLDLLSEGKIPIGATLVIEKLDRLSRAHPMRQLPLIDSILRAGVRIATLSPDRFYTAENIEANPYIVYEILSHAMSGYEESSKKSYRLREVWQKKRDRVSTGEIMTTNAPGWLTVEVEDEKRVRFVEVPQNAATLRRIFKLATEGLGGPKIARALNADNVPSFSWRVPLKWMSWQTMFVVKLLNDRRVIGELQSHRDEDDKTTPIGDPHRKYYPPVIDEDTFAIVQVGLRTRFNKRGAPEKWRVNVFKGLLTDARSGNPFGINSYDASNHASPKRKRVRLVVRAQADTGGGCKGSFMYAKFETSFFKFVSELKASDFTGVAAIEANRLAGLSSRLTLATEQLAELGVRWKAEKDAKRRASLLDLRMEVEEERDGVKAEYDALKMSVTSPAVELISDTQSLVSLIETADDPDALRMKIRARLKQLVTQIWLLVYDRRGARHAVCQVDFRDGTHRVFHTGYSLTPKPYSGDEGVTERITRLGVNLATIRDDYSPYVREVGTAPDGQVNMVVWLTSEPSPDYSDVDLTI